MFVYNEKIRMIFAIAIIAILVIGFVGGIVAGFSLRGPSKATLENYQETLENASRYIYSYKNDLAHATEQLAKEEDRWGAESTIAMLLVWVISAISAVFGYGILLILEMLDDTMFAIATANSAAPKLEHTGYSLSELASEATTDNSASWICKECGTKNTSNAICCKDCGRFNKK